jgi:hypothetical protein
MDRMTVRIRNVTFGCKQPYQLARFWQRVTGFGEDPDYPNLPDDPEALLVAPDGSIALLFVPVEEPRSGPWRLHLDLVPTDRTRDAEVERVLGVGATLVADRRRPDGTGWVVLADPEGNEFCIERSDAER